MAVSKVRVVESSIPPGAKDDWLMGAGATRDERTLIWLGTFAGLFPGGSFSSSSSCSSPPASTPHHLGESGSRSCTWPSCSWHTPYARSPTAGRGDVSGPRASGRWHTRGRPV